jgi:hypothetical protein
VTVDPLTFITLGICSLTYSLFMRLVAITAQRRYEYRTGQYLHWGWACVWGALWPVLMVVWIIAALVLPFEQRPASLLYEPSKATRAAWRIDQRRKEQIQATKDWEERATFWYAEGQRAEAEDSQTLKWLVAQQLEFLLDTRPGGAETPEEKAKRQDEMRALDQAKAREEIKKTSSKPISEWPSHGERMRTAQRAHQKRTVPSLYTAVTPKAANIGTTAVGFCNICHRYRDHQLLTLKGVCRECSEQQGLS